MVLQLGHCYLQAVNKYNKNNTCNKSIGLDYLYITWLKLYINNITHSPSSICDIIWAMPLVRSYTKSSTVVPISSSILEVDGFFT